MVDYIGQIYKSWQYFIITLDKENTHWMFLRSLVAAHCRIWSWN